MRQGALCVQVSTSLEWDSMNMNHDLQRAHIGFLQAYCSSLSLTRLIACGRKKRGTHIRGLLPSRETARECVRCLRAAATSNNRREMSLVTLESLQKQQQLKQVNVNKRSTCRRALLGCLRCFGAPFLIRRLSNPLASRSHRRSPYRELNLDFDSRHWRSTAAGVQLLG